MMRQKVVGIGRGRDPSICARHRIPTDLLATRLRRLPMAESAADPEVNGPRPAASSRSMPSMFEKSPRIQVSHRHLRRLEGVIDGCAETGEARRNTWIAGRSAKPMSSPPARSLPSVSLARGELAGGLYEVRARPRLLGESMFSASATRRRLARCIWSSGSTSGAALLDTQFTTDHLKRFGAVDVPRRKYEKR